MSMKIILEFNDDDEFEVDAAIRAINNKSAYFALYKIREYLQQDPDNDISIEDFNEILEYENINLDNLR